MKHLFFTIIIALAITSYSYSQVTREWVQRYNNGYDVAYSMAIDGSGNVYVTGSSTGSGASYDYATIKYNSAGVQQWIQRYNGTGNSDDEAHSIAVDDSGNVYVTGRSIGIGTYYDYATIKYNSLGDSLWVQRYNGPGNGYDGASSIALDASGNVYVTGGSTGSGTNSDYATIKYNSSGVQQWIKRYNGTGNSDDEAHSIAVDDSGNVFVTGGSDGSGTGSDYTTIKYNSLGDSLWVQRYNGPGNGYDVAYSMAIDGSGNVYVSGSSTGSGTISNYATIKYNSSGVQQWVQRYNGPGNGHAVAYSITVDNSGNVYVTGYAATIKYNSLGDSIWVQRYNGPGSGYDIAYSIALDTSGNVYVTGGTGGTNSNYSTIKYNSSGVQQWVQRYNGSGNSDDVAYFITVDNSGNVYVTGRSIGMGTSSDYMTIKYSQLTGISQNLNSIPNKFSLSQNYPNPFNPSTVIRYQLSVSSFASLKVFDVLGNEVATLVNEKQNAGSYSVEWDASNFSSGIYFYKIESNGFVQTNKMTLLK